MTDDDTPPDNEVTMTGPLADLIASEVGDHAKASVFAESLCRTFMQQVPGLHETYRWLGKPRIGADVPDLVRRVAQAAEEWGKLPMRARLNLPVNPLQLAMDELVMAVRHEALVPVLIALGLAELSDPTALTVVGAIPPENPNIGQKWKDLEGVIRSWNGDDWT